MKKRIILTVFTLAIILLTGNIYATSASPENKGYNFDIVYTGDIIAGEEKKATVILEGKDATPYTNVRVKFEFISGPATPKIMAFEDNGKGYDMIETVYWGPDSGFPVGNTFRNETPVTATYPKAGKYITKLSLIDKTQDDAVIISKEFTTNVLEAPTTDVENNNVVEEIPQTGISIWTYALIVAGVISILYLANRIIKK